MAHRLLIIFVSMFLVLGAGPGACSSAKPPVGGEVKTDDSGKDSKTAINPEAAKPISGSTAPVPSNRLPKSGNWVKDKAQEIWSDTKNQFEDVVSKSKNLWAQGVYKFSQFMNG